jgi:diguanylate cyclase (GGDEF)-like protein
MQDIIDSATGLVVAMISIDNFEKLSNSFEKPSVDKVIITLSEILRTSTDYRDSVIKLEEDEFCLILKNRNLSSAAELLTNIIFETKNATLTSTKNENIKFTISAGLAIHDNDNFQETLSQADLLLYNAKQNGGNQIVAN